ncbi:MULTISPECIES: polyhydroxyalkanoate depolymerase [Roseobacteraceae]|uniref:Polyhydroxyalkanoate depolymerase n=1 Tax=Celeribacter baekdonensis B30 TaxID=1208323 RepID=K2K7Q9_9RHOB|nr:MULTISPECIES: polyhydroxyalkanoate depolymerase [Roseobacteraceae]EKE73425.1 polyhydroxyalkanoate depolymerase [Celeribacter baekdonensis B30]KAB6717502.1 polyhydroxyalkanoate depolymerase [Roseobacter sp. TSBP12]
MRFMATYDFMETMRNTNQWLGASALALGSYPAMAMVPNPAIQWLTAWGQVTERSFARMAAKPDWGIQSVVGEDGRDHIVDIEVEVSKAFGDLIHFKVQGRKEMARKVLLVAPMSGHYATLLRSTVVSLLPDCELYITDWHNARDIPVSEGKFDVEDYTLYLVDFMKYLGPQIHVIAVCQPAPLTLAATAYLAEEDPKAQPRSLTLIGGPIDPDATPTEVTDFGNRITMGQLEQSMIQRVGYKYKGVGRKVYPGLLQLSSFIAMNSESHTKAFKDQINRVAKGEASDHDKHNKFYDEYLAVMDMTGEFYLSTVERIFKGLEIAKNEFVVAGKRVDIGKITDVAVKTVEGENDDISAPGQCVAALRLCTGLPDSKKAWHLEPGAGHYGIFAGKSWRNNIRPLVLDFIDANSGPRVVAGKDTTRPSTAAKAKTKAAG